MVFLFALCSCDHESDPRDTLENNSEEQNEDDPGEEEIKAGLPTFTGLAGTKWLWGQSLLEFNDNGTVRFRGRAPDYPYTVDGGTLVDGQPGGGAITTLGTFTINAERDTLEILNYRNNAPAEGTGTLEGITKTYNAVFLRRDPATLTQEFLTELSTSTMVGTEWNVGGVGGGSNGDRFKNCQWIIFFNKTEAVNQSGGGVFVDTYTFNKEKRRCQIYYINDFIIRSNWDSANTPSYKEYNHAMDYARVW
jgi:hypothetical protein